MKANQTLLLLAGGGLLLWLASRKPASGEGRVMLAGSIGGVQVETAQVATMGTHLVRKTPNALITARITWSALTRDGLGIGRAWPYKLIMELGHATIGGWQNAEQMGFPVAAISTTVTGAVTGPGQILNAFATAPNAPNASWDVRVKLFAKNVDATGDAPVSGNLDSDFTILQTFTHTGAVLTTGSIALSGTIDLIEVSQHPYRHKSPLLR